MQALVKQYPTTWRLHLGSTVALRHVLYRSTAKCFLFAGVNGKWPNAKCHPCMLCVAWGSCLHQGQEKLRIESVEKQGGVCTPCTTGCPQRPVALLSLSSHSYERETAAGYQVPPPHFPYQGHFSTHKVQQRKAFQAEMRALKQKKQFHQRKTGPSTTDTSKKLSHGREYEGLGFPICLCSITWRWTRTQRSKD